MADLNVAEFVMLQEGMTDSQKLMFMSQYGSMKKDRIVALVLSLFLGQLGVDRFYLGDVGLGVIKLVTCGGFLIWAFIDLFLIMGRTDEINRNLAHDVANNIKYKGAAGSMMG